MRTETCCSVPTPAVNELNVALLPFDAVPGALDTDTAPSPLDKTWGFVAFTRLQLSKFNDGTSWDNGGAVTEVGGALNTADVVVAHLSKVELTGDTERVWALPVSNQPVIVNVAAGRLLQGAASEPDCPPLPRAATAAQAVVQRLRYQPNGFEGYPALAVQRIGTGQVSVEFFLHDYGREKGHVGAAYGVRRHLRDLVRCPSPWRCRGRHSPRALSLLCLSHTSMYQLLHALQHPCP